MQSEKNKIHDLLLSAAGSELPSNLSTMKLHGSLTLFVWDEGGGPIDPYQSLLEN